MKTVFYLCCLAVCALAAAQTAKPPAQPLPFSHRAHAGEMQLKCGTCHKNPNPGERMGFPPSIVCMQCHSDIKTDSPAIQKLASSAESKREIRWARVYEIPTYVRFSHRAHIATGSVCADCHGKVEEREQLYREGDISMAGCMNCHRARKASIDCLYCHDQMQQ
jgi:hypothetical protein